MTEPALRWLSAALLHLTWQGLLVALAAHLAFRLVGSSASIARYRIALGAMTLLALAPAGTLARRAGWLAGASPGWVAALPERFRPDAAPANPAAVATIARFTPRASAPRLPALPRTTGAPLPWLFAAWLVGALLFLIRLGGGMARLQAFRRRATVAPPPIAREVERLARGMGIIRTPEVRISGEVRIPLTFGALRPVVLLPDRFADQLPAHQVRLVLSHELAHVVRRDYLVNLAQCVVEALLFFHPAVHWLARIAREEREHCCDERAASIAGDRREVARALVALEELVGPRHAGTLAPAATGGILLRRIERLVASAPPPGRFHTVLSLGVLVLAIALVILATPATARAGAATPTLVRTTDGFSEVWSGVMAPGRRLRVRNLVGAIRVDRVPGERASIRARIAGGVLTDLAFTPIADAEGVTVCALRAAHGRCDREGYTWVGTPQEMHRARIDLVVELPAGAGISAAGFEGDLALHGVSGDVEARTGSGSITAVVEAGRDDRTLELHTGAGTVKVALPRGFGGTLQARLTNGTVEHEMPLAPMDRFSPQEMRASFGPGGNRLRASSGNGSLVLTRGP